MHIKSNELLIIIDPQKDFTAPGYAYGKRHPQLSRITAVKQHLNKMIQATDPSKIVIVYSDYRPDHFGDGFSCCIPGTEGHKIDLDIPEGIIKIAKTGHSCFSSIVFKNYLTKTGITTLILTGFLTEYCVQATAADARAMGFTVLIIPELLGSADDKNEARMGAIRFMISRGVQKAALS